MVVLLYNSDGHRSHYRLTWQGHDFLEAIKDETRWSNIKKVMDEAGGFVLSIARQVAFDMLKDGADNAKNLLGF